MSNAPQHRRRSCDWTTSPASTAPTSTAVRALAGVSLDVRRRRARRRHGPERLRQVHPAQPRRRARRARPAGRCSSRAQSIGTLRGDALAKLRRRRGRLRLPGLQPDPRRSPPSRTSPCRSSSTAQRAARPGAGPSDALDDGRRRRARRPLPRQDVRRPAAARRDRPRAGRRPPPGARRRAHRGPRLAHRRGGAAACCASAATPARPGVLVTHEARHAAWADRVVFLRDGVVVDSTGSAPDGRGPARAGRLRPRMTTLTEPRRRPGRSAARSRPRRADRLAGSPGGAPRGGSPCGWPRRDLRRHKGRGDPRVPHGGDPGGPAGGRSDPGRHRADRRDRPHRGTDGLRSGPRPRRRRGQAAADARPQPGRDVIRLRQPRPPRSPAIHHAARPAANADAVGRLVGRHGRPRRPTPRCGSVKGERRIRVSGLVVDPPWHRPRRQGAAHRRSLGHGLLRGRRHPGWRSPRASPRPGTVDPVGQRNRTHGHGRRHRRGPQ